jgi:hypothetical protein
VLNLENNLCWVRNFGVLRFDGFSSENNIISETFEAQLKLPVSNKHLRGKTVKA